MKGIRIIWKSHNSLSKKGYLRISVRDSELKKTKVISLNLPPISENYFDKKNQLVKKSYKDCEIYNNEIERILNKFSLRKDSNFINEEKKSLNFFVEEKLIKDCNNEGTKEKYRNVLNLLILYNKDKYKSPTIFMKSITIDYINEWKIWLRKVRRNTENTISYKIKTFSSFINKSINNGYYLYHPNPFKSIKNIITETPKGYLSEEELERLQTTELKDFYRSNNRLGEIKNENYNKRNSKMFSVNDVRMWFLYSLFQNGKRVSDVITLKWSNFYFEGDELRYRKRMIKTKNYLESMIYYPSMFIILKYIPKEVLSEEEDKEINDLIEKNDIISKENSKQNKDVSSNIVLVKFRNIYEFDFNKNENNEYELSEKLLENKLEEIESEIRNVFKLKNNYLSNKRGGIDIELQQTINNDERLNQLHGLLINIKKENQLHKILIDRTLEDNNNRLYNLLINIILRLKRDKNYSNNFVFPILNNEDFKDITREDSFDNMTEFQYKKFIGRRGYYNRLLKQIGNQCNIQNLTSHISRHSYTSLLLKNKDVNLYDLMKSLGHKNLSTTQVYIQKFGNSRIDQLGKDFSDTFSKNMSPNQFT